MGRLGGKHGGWRVHYSVGLRLIKTLDWRDVLQQDSNLTPKLIAAVGRQTSNYLFVKIAAACSIDNNERGLNHTFIPVESWVQIVVRGWLNFAINYSTLVKQYIAWSLPSLLAPAAWNLASIVSASQIISKAKDYTFFFSKEFPASTSVKLGWVHVERANHGPVIFNQRASRIHNSEVQCTPAQLCYCESTYIVLKVCDP